MTALPSPAPTVQSGPTPPKGAMLGPWDVVVQNSTWAPDSAYTSERSEECGQACLVMCLRWASGIWTPAAYLHDLVHARGEAVGTTFDQLQATLAVMETHSIMHWPRTAADVRALVEASIAAGYPLIPLRWFSFAGNRDSSGNDLLHFTCIIGYTPTLIQQAGPWSGTLFTETDEEFMTMFYGGVLQVRRRRKLGDH